MQAVADGPCTARRLFKKAVQQGRSERRVEAYSPLYLEPLSDARTKLADFFNSLLVPILPGVRSNHEGEESPVMSRMFAEHLTRVVQGALLFGMLIFVAATVRDLWLSLRDDE